MSHEEGVRKVQKVSRIIWTASDYLEKSQQCFWTNVPKYVGYHLFVVEVNFKPLCHDKSASKIHKNKI